MANEQISLFLMSNRQFSPASASRRSQIFKHRSRNRSFRSWSHKDTVPIGRNPRWGDRRCGFSRRLHPSPAGRGDEVDKPSNRTRKVISSSLRLPPTSGDGHLAPADRLGGRELPRLPRLRGHPLFRRLLPRRPFPPRPLRIRGRIFVPPIFILVLFGRVFLFFFGRRLSQFIFMEHEGFGGSDEC